MNKRVAIILVFFLLYAFFVQNRVWGQQSAEQEEINELTIYVIPSHLYVNWDSPSTLYKTTALSWFYAKFHKYSYGVGHLFIELNTPLLKEPIMTSIRSTGNKEKKRMILKDKVGLGLIGAAMPGRMESREELSASIDYNVKKDREIAFIKYRINRSAALRIIEYINGFTQKGADSIAPCDFYGGGFWPRYEKEGAGCSSFGIVAMDVAGLKIDYPEWIHSVNIPSELLGGEFNKFRKVMISKIERSRTWYKGDGAANVDYFPFFIYDPTLIYDWIMKQRDSLASGTGKSSNQFIPEEKKQGRGTIPGLYMDASSIAAPEDPIFTKRKERSVFVDCFFNSRFFYK